MKDYSRFLKNPLRLHVTGASPDCQPVKRPVERQSEQQVTGDDWLEPPPPLDLQPLLEHFAGHLLVLVKGMSINVQRGGWLAVAQEARHRGHVRAVCNE